MINLMALGEENKLPGNLCVVRVSTSSWSDKRGVYTKRSVTYQKRLSCGFNILEEDLGNLGPEDVVERIVNLLEAKDGLYKLILTNVSRDWETNHVDDYDYELVPYIKLRQK